MYKRRSFIRNLVLSAAALNTVPSVLFSSERKFPLAGSEDKPLHIALIGKGGMGTADTNSALRINGIELVAVCDIYDKRLEDARRAWGEKLFVTRDYHEILAIKDLDAVIVATPDHWHQQITIEALRAGKHVYCEKPVIHKLKEGKNLIKALDRSNCVFQMGTQGISSFGNAVAQNLVQAGAIGKVNQVEAQFTAPPGRLSEFVKPIDATEQSIWWDRFLGDAPKHEFEPQRFFSWRNWKDYGTGLAGDLFVHVISSLHFITGAVGPEKVYTTGGLHYYKNGSRDTPDIMLGLFDYPDRNDIGAFKMTLGANIVDGISKKWGSSDIRIIGNKGTLNVGWERVVLKTLEKANSSDFAQLRSLYSDLNITGSEDPKELVFELKSNPWNAHVEHFRDFFTAIRTKQPNIADVRFAVRASSTALLSFESYLKGKPILWDAEKMKVNS